MTPILPIFGERKKGKLYILTKLGLRKKKVGLATKIGLRALSCFLTYFYFAWRAIVRMPGVVIILIFLKDINQYL